MSRIPVILPTNGFFSTPVSVSLPEPETYHCHLCNYQTLQELFLKNHLKELHKIEEKDKGLTNDEIEKEILRIKKYKKISCEDDLEKTEKSLYECIMCEYKTKFLSTFKQHLNTHTGENLYQCDICDYETHNVSLLGTHRLIKHTDKKPFTCTFCDFKTNRNNSLKRHLQKHTGQRRRSAKCVI